MTNPYIILGLSLDADENQIARAQLTAIRAHKYSMQEITAAQTSLRNPQERLAADFTYPARMVTNVPVLTVVNHGQDIDLTNLNDDKYDSLGKSPLDLKKFGV